MFFLKNRRTCMKSKLNNILNSCTLFKKEEHVLKLKKIKFFLPYPLFNRRKCMEIKVN